jgi:sortase A
MDWKEKEDEVKKNDDKRWTWVPHLLRIVGLMIGAGILFYPTISSRWNKYRDAMLISDYTRTVNNYSEDQYKDVFVAAKAYNDQHLSNYIMDAFDESTEDYILTHPYDTLLNPMGDYVMGYIEIPKIDLRLPIYHGVGTEALEKGAGHIEGTSLPIGGPGTHAVLSGHRGLPGRKLFTDLDLIKEGDQFYLQVLNETLAYEVDQILTVLPHESKALDIVPGEDLVTLVTCTPYGVNSHRLLIRGHRIPFKEEAKEEQKRDVVEKVKNAGMEEKLVMIGLAVFFTLCILFWILSEIKRRKRR